MILLTKFFPDPVQPLKESAKALFGDLLFRCPTIALSTVSVTKCCPNTRRRRADCRPVMFAQIPGGGGTPIHYLYRYEGLNGVNR